MGRKPIHTVHSVDEDDSRRIQGRRDFPLLLSRQGPVMWADINAGVETIINVGSVIAIIGENKEARNVWKELKLRKIQRIIHQTLHRAWREALTGPSIDESYPGAGEFAELLRMSCKTKKRTAEAIIQYHTEHMKGVLESLPDHWLKRGPEAEPPADWDEMADFLWVATFHLLCVAALAQTGGFNINHQRTQCLCFACLLGQKEASDLLENCEDYQSICTTVARRFPLREKAKLQFNLRTMRGIDPGLIEEETTQDIIAAARSVFSV